jgi:DNA gyrase/topoisomerase IV subunit B
MGKFFIGEFGSIEEGAGRILDYYNNWALPWSHIGKEPFPERTEIEETLESLKQIQYHKKYPNLVSKYPELGRYCGKVIYTFSVDYFSYSKSELKKKFNEMSSKSTNENISLCGINETSPEWEKVKSEWSVCLYIGSSKNIRQRLKEHLFLCNQNKSAMHLEKWLEPNVSIKITIWGFKNFLDSEKSSDDLDKMEHIMNSYCQPLFEKQRKNKKGD